MTGVPQGSEDDSEKATSLPTTARVTGDDDKSAGRRRAKPETAGITDDGSQLGVTWCAQKLGRHETRGPGEGGGHQG